MSEWQNSTENGTESDWPYMFDTNIRLGISLDDWDEYESGAIDATRSCDQQARILAFGAIRRAAEMARSWDCCPELHHNCHDKATEIRLAIRAAIGSGKA